MSLKPEDSNVVDRWHELTNKQLLVLEDWVQHFSVKKAYPVIGKVTGYEDAIAQIEVAIDLARVEKNSANATDDNSALVEPSKEETAAADIFSRIRCSVQRFFTQ